MWKRIRHWTSQGFIYNLGHLRHSELLAQCNESIDDIQLGMDTQRTDESLATALRRLEPTARKEIMENYRISCRNSGLVLPKEDFATLLEALNDSMPQGARAKMNTKAAAEAGLKAEVKPDAEVGTSVPRRQSVPYNDQTCVEFHHLFVSLLLGYGRALFRRAIEDRKPVADNKPMVDVWNYAHLLWRVVSSQMFACHMEVLKRGGWLSGLPRAELSPLYKQFVQYEAVPISHGLDAQSGKVEDGKDATVEGVGVKEKGAAMTREHKGDEDDDDDDVDVAELLKEESPRDNLRTFHIFKNWIRLNISHFVSLRILSFGGGKSYPKVDISLIVVNQDRQERKVLDWAHIIKDLDNSAPVSCGATSSLDAEFLINSLQKRIDECCHSRHRTPKIFRAFGTTVGKRIGQGSQVLNLCAGQVLSHNHLHCETVLAALIVYGDKVLKEGCKKLRDLIAVCCCMY